MAVAPQLVKSCVACGADVGGKPRVRDAQGRYRCKGMCETKPVTVAAVSAKAGAPPVDDLLTKLIDESPISKATPCPQCSTPMLPNSVLCTSCGFNTTTNKRVKTAIIREKEPKAPKPVAGGGRKYAAYSTDMPYFKALGMSAAVLVPIGIVGGMVPAASLAVLILLAVVGFALFVGTIVVAFREDQTMWGWIGICSIVPLVNVIASIPFLVYSYILVPSNKIKAAHLTVLVTWIAYIASAVVSGNDLMKSFGNP